MSTFIVFMIETLLLELNIKFSIKKNNLYTIINIIYNENKILICIYGKYNEEDYGTIYCKSNILEKFFCLDIKYTLFDISLNSNIEFRFSSVTKLFNKGGENIHLLNYVENVLSEFFQIHENYTSFNSLLISESENNSISVSNFCKKKAYIYCLKKKLYRIYLKPNNSSKIFKYY